MSDGITSRESHGADGQDPWRLLPEGAVTAFRSGSVAVSVAVVPAIGDLVPAGHEPDIDGRVAGGRATRPRITARGMRAIALVAALTILHPGVAHAAPLAYGIHAPRSLPAWDGSIDLYRKGVFTTQGTWLWCTAAGVQIVRNIVERDDDHANASQRRYFDWMRGRNRYDLPESAGVDPQGWTAGLRHFVDDRYRLVASTSFEAGVRSAAANLRRTNLPVALTVAHGGHGWIMTGFEATADPLLTDAFEVTSVRVVGPLYGRQSRDGYDMPPGTELSVERLRRFFTAWHYDPLPMVWDGRFVSIQPVAEHDGPPIAVAARAARFATELLAIPFSPADPRPVPPGPAGSAG